MRKPIFIRSLTQDEQRQIQTGLRSSDAFALRRCQILTALYPATFWLSNFDLAKNLRLTNCLLFLFCESIYSIASKAKFHHATPHRHRSS
jgi:hypothetical protein